MPNTIEHMHRDEYVIKYGGKAGLHKFLRDKGNFNTHLLPTLYILPGQSPKKIMNKDNWNYSDVILRSSNFCDLKGLVDILLTGSEFNDTDEIFEEAKRYRSYAKNTKVRKYACSENPLYDGKITLMIQPKLQAIGERGIKYGPLIRGSVAEHPNKKGAYIFSFVEQARSIKNFTGLIATEELIKEDEKIRSSGGAGTFYRQLKFARPILNVYRKMCDALGYEESVHMEFGINYIFPELDQIIIHQARIFKPYEEPIVQFERGLKAHIVIGNANELELDVIRTESIEKTPQYDKPFIWFPKTIYQSDKLDLTPVSENMKGFVTNAGSSTISLEHNLYRFVQKSQVSLLGITREIKGNRIKLNANGDRYKAEILE